MAKVKLLTDGGYKGLEPAVGKVVEAKKLVGCWYIQSEDLRVAGANPCMKEYIFLRTEVEVQRCHTHGL